MHDFIYIELVVQKEEPYSIAVYDLCKECKQRTLLFRNRSMEEAIECLKGVFDSIKKNGVISLPPDGFKYQ